MNELVITPNFEKKSAKIRGRCAAGEHVLVRLVGMAGLPAETLRLCIMLRERLFAVFPLAIEDSAAEWSVDGGDLTCVLNLNTEPLVKFARCGALTLEFILDDPSNHILYFSEMHQVQPWHSLRASGDDAQPRDMPPFDGVVISTKSLGDLREAVRRLAEKGGAKIISSVAIALLAFSGAFAATVQTIPLNDLDFDANPSVVTNVVFDAPPDFSTNNVALVETIEATAPAPGNYAAVSNRAMTALQSYTETDPTVPAWAKAETQPLPPNYSTISNKAMTALQSFTETDPTVSSWAKAATKPSYSWSEITSKPSFAAVATSGSYNDLSNKPTIPTVPTNVSAFNNDAGYLTGYTEADPTVPQWAKSAQKPTYTASEVGAVPTTGGTMTGGLTVPTLTVGSRKAGSTVGVNSVAEGYNSTAGGVASHAEGRHTITRNRAEHAQGTFNSSHTGQAQSELTLSSIGFGTADNDRKNAVETMQNGKTFIYGLGGYDGTNPTGTGVQDLASAVNSKASHSDITVKSVKVNGTALTPDADGAVNVQATTPADIPPAVSNIVTAAYINDRVNVTPLAGRTYNFATNIGLYTAVRDVILALGGSVTNFPAIPQN